MNRRKLWNDVQGFVDVGVGISIGILFAGLMVISYIIWTLKTQLLPVDPVGQSDIYNQMWNSTKNLTTGFDNTINLLLIVVVVWLLALAIMALLIIKKRAG